MFGALNPKRGGGITLLLPSKEVQEEIDAEVGKDAKNAVDLIKSLILKTYIPSINDFNDNVVNLIGMKLPVKKVSSNTVELINDGKITEQTSSKFTPLFTERINIACYKLEGKIPVSDIPAETTGKYEGGRDSDYSKYGRNIIQGSCWKTHVSNIKDQVKNYIKRGVNGVDPLTLTLLSLAISNQKINSAKIEEFTDYMPCSPLAALFLGEYFSTQELKEWSMLGKEYNNKDVLNKLYGDFKQHGTKFESIQDMTPDTIGAKMAGQVKEMTNNDIEDFNYYILGAQEFCYYFTMPYINAIRTRDSSQVEHIFNYYLTHINGQTGRKRCLFVQNSPVDFETFQKERFCSSLSFYVNDAFLTTGLNTDSKGKTDGENMGEYIYGWGKDVRPDNLTTPTSFHNELHEFWENI
jgi:hypothetical protein